MQKRLAPAAGARQSQASEGLRLKTCALARTTVRVSLSMATRRRIAFIEAESAEQEWLSRKLSEHDLYFAAGLPAADFNPDIVSIFLNSRIDPGFFENHASVELITTRSTTTEHIDLAECARRGVTVCNVPRYGDYTVAEHTFALILGLVRRLREAMDSTKHAAFSYEEVRGTELRGKTLGVVGAGLIGENVIRMSKAFGLRTIVHDIEPQAQLARDLEFSYVTFDDLLAQSHIISLHAPLTAETYHLFDRAAFAKCRPGVFIVNTARGGLIETDALCEALNSGMVAGAGLDVLEDERVMRRETSHIIGDQIIERLHANFPPRELRAPDNSRVRELQSLMLNHKLLERPNVLFTPHIAFNSTEAIERILTVTVENIRGFLTHAPVNVVRAKAEA